MGAPIGNKNSVGHKGGGGRPSFRDEKAASEELTEIWENPEKLEEAMEAIKKGKPALKHIFVATAAQDGGLALLNTIAKKKFPDVLAVKGDITVEIRKEMEEVKDGLKKLTKPDDNEGA